MGEIDYGRLSALEAALGGRAAIQEAYVAGRSLVPKHIVFPFAFDTPGLTEGVPVYAPEVGDRLLNAWVEISEAWDLDTGHCDVGTFVDTNLGFMEQGGGGVNPLDQPDVSYGGAISPNVGGENVQFAQGAFPIRFAEAPLLLVVSHDGFKGGADPGSTQGVAELHLWVIPAA